MRGLRFNEKYLGGKITFMMTYGDSSVAEQTRAPDAQRFSMFSLALSDGRLTGGDVPPESYQKRQGFSVSLQIGDAREADHIGGGVFRKQEHHNEGNEPMHAANVPLHSRGGGSRT